MTVTRWHREGTKWVMVDEEDEMNEWKAVAVAAPSVSGGIWVIYGMARWPSYSHMLCPGTFDIERW
jgi:hypothetical protein